eukprot:gene28910-34887_t
MLESKEDNLDSDALDLEAAIPKSIKEKPAKKPSHNSPRIAPAPIEVDETPINDATLISRNPPPSTLTNIISPSNTAFQITPGSTRISNKAKKQGAYDGAMNEQGQRHGYGVMKYTNGDVYEGMWETDKKHGLGKQIHRNGDIYEGEFVHGRKHGKGKYTYASGDSYEGGIVNGMREGWGVYRFVNGSTYTYHTGAQYTGDWEGGDMQGKGQMVYPGGERYEGEWKGGVMHGPGKYLSVAGKVVEAVFQFGKAMKKGLAGGTGDPTAASTNVPEDLYVGDYNEEGEKHGKGVMTYKNGDVYEG